MSALLPHAPLQLGLDPFRITGPACISFSGGRTSGLMLRRILDAHGGQLPADVHVIFANTGREREETLRFVRDCGERWGVPIHWVEYDGKRGKAGERSYREVTFETASRRGEPFAQLIADKQALPNWQARWCTSELKVLRARAWMRAHGYEAWTDAVGLRADEPERVTRRVDDAEVSYAVPLYRAGVTRADVLAYWRAAPFDLALPDGEGNCDACFMMGVRELRRRVAARPELAEWWAARERETGHTFSSRWTYAALREAALVPVESLSPRWRQMSLFDEEAIPCACTD